MTTQQAPDEAQQDTGRPAQSVRVPNVSPGAKSGLDHIVIGSNALDFDLPDYTRQEAKGPQWGQHHPDQIPEDATTVDALLDWVNGDRERAQTALAAEQGRDEPRVTLVEPLERLLADDGS